MRVSMDAWDTQEWDLGVRRSALEVEAFGSSKMCQNRKYIYWSLPPVSDIELLKLLQLPKP